MKDKLLQAGFLDTQTGTLVLKNDRFEVKAFDTPDGWKYTWKSLVENCGGGPNSLMNITQINFYL